MTGEIPLYLSTYGLPLIFAIAFFSCLAFPVPASLAFMGAGTLAAAGELEVMQIWLAGLSGAILGDNIGYLAAAKFTNYISDRTANNGRVQKGLKLAEEFTQKWGNWSVFLSRWLFSPMGPWTNFTCGISNYSWKKFAVFAALGEVVWVSLYVGIGYNFSSNMQLIADLIGNGIWLLVALIITFVIGKKLFQSSN